MRVLRNALALLLVCNSLLSFPSIAEGLKGKWGGNIEIGTQLVPVVFNITVSDTNSKQPWIVLCKVLKIFPLNRFLSVAIR